MDAQQSTPSDSPATPHLAQDTPSLASAMRYFDEQFQALNAKIDLIVAAVDDNALQVTAAAQPGPDLPSKVAELEKQNHDLKAQANRAQRKTLSPMVTALLAKQGFEGDAAVEAPVVEKALSGLSIEQRIAVKAELARAGVLV
jgi:hypothetical protein